MEFVERIINKDLQNMGKKDKSQQNMRKNTGVKRKKFQKEYEEQKGRGLSQKLATRLKNIIEVSEQDEPTHRFNERELENQKCSLVSTNNKNLLIRSMDCLCKIFQCLRRQNKFKVTVSEKEFINKIEEIRNEGIKSLPVLSSPPPENRKTIVLDFDQTLIFSTIVKPQQYDFTFDLNLKEKIHKIYCKNRFGLELFLFELSQLYEVIVYSSGTKHFVDSILDHIDKKGRISARIYRDKCIQFNEIYFLKSIKLLGRDKEKVIFIDNNPSSGVLQPQNFLQIKPFTGQGHDRELIKLIPFLKQVEKLPSVLHISRKLQKYCNQQIKLKFNSLDQSSIDPRRERKASSSKMKEVDDLQDKENIFEELRLKKKKIQENMKMNDKRKKYGHQRANSQSDNFKVKTTEDDEQSYKQGVGEEDYGNGNGNQHNSQQQTKYNEQSSNNNDEGQIIEEDTQCQLVLRCQDLNL